MKFQRLIEDLVEAGWTQKQIADEVGCSQPNIARLLGLKKAEPKWSIGQALIDLHHDEC